MAGTTRLELATSAVTAFSRGCQVAERDCQEPFAVGKLVGKNFSVGIPCWALERASSFLTVASTFGDQQNLTARMTVPIQLCTSLIGFSSCTPQVDLLYTEPHGSV